MACVLYFYLTFGGFGGECLFRGQEGSEPQNIELRNIEYRRDGEGVLTMKIMKGDEGKRGETVGRL